MKTDRNMTIEMKYNIKPPLGGLYIFIAMIASLMIIASPGVSSVADNVGDALMLGGAILGIAITLPKLSRSMLPPLLCGFAFVCYYLVNSFSTTSSLTGIRHTLAAFAGISALLFFSRYGSIIRSQKIWSRCLILLCLVSIALVATSSMQKNIASGTIAYLASIITALSIEDRDDWLKPLAFGVSIAFLGYLNEFRALIPLSFAFMITWTFYDRVPRLISFFSIIVILLLFSYSIIWFYTNIFTSSLAADISYFISSISGRPATSGREWLWPIIISAASTSPIYGVGSGIIPANITSTEYSSHNYYLQTFLQVGILGISFLISLLIFTLHQISNKNLVCGRFGLSLFVMFIIHNSSEVIMLQNGMTAGLMAWTAIGICISSDRQFLQKNAI